MPRKTVKENLLDRLERQRNWIIEHGKTREAYIKRYGSPDTNYCYGNGGAKIFEADMAELKRLEKLCTRKEFVSMFFNHGCPNCHSTDVRRACKEVIEGQTVTKELYDFNPVDVSADHCCVCENCGHVEMMLKQKTPKGKNAFTTPVANK